MKARAVAVAAVLLVAILGPATAWGEPPAISLGISGPADGATMNGNVAKLAMEVMGVTIVAPNGDTSGKTGHFHVFIDRDPVPVGTVIPEEKGIVHSETNPIVVPGLALGAHRLTVVIGDAEHRRISDATATTNVNVAGAAIQASDPATAGPAGPALARTGRAMRLELALAGVLLVLAGFCVGLNGRREQPQRV